MEEFIGIIELKYQNINSKSEGLIPYLVVDSTGDTKITYRLYRSGVYGVNDDFFVPYDNMMVTVQGNIEMKTWINVEQIHELDTEKDTSK